MGRRIKKKRWREDEETEGVPTGGLYTDPESASEVKDRSVYLMGEINEQSAAVVTSKLAGLAQVSERPIRLVINTYGGSIDESLAIYDTMKLIRAPVHTIGIGKIMSAGVLLLAAGTKGKRLIGARARIMIHNAWGGMIGDPWELKTELKEFERLARLEEECLLAESKMTRKQLDKILKNRLEHYVTPEEVVKFGIADKITS